MDAVFLSARPQNIVFIALVVICTLLLVNMARKSMNLAGVI